MAKGINTWAYIQVQHSAERQLYAYLVKSRMHIVSKLYLRHCSRSLCGQTSAKPNDTYLIERCIEHTMFTWGKNYKVDKKESPLHPNTY